MDWKAAQLSSSLLVHARREEAVAVPLALAEALKTRVITKGPPLLMTYLKPFQKFCWKVLSKHPVFELTGRTIDSDYIQSRLGKRLATNQRFLSVDYSDATNEIHSWCSEVAAVEICEVLGLSRDFEILLLRSLTGHTLEYEGERADQQTGQLMGSITSFIFLCIVNASICRWSIELDQDKCKMLRDCPLAINGDDAVFRVTDFGKDCWEKIARCAGMSPSIGKVYFSSSFLNMNSATFTFDAEGHECEYSPMWTVVPRKYFTMVPFINMGLLSGFTRSSTGEVSSSFSGTKDPSLGARCRELVGTAPDSLSEKLIAKFVSTFSDQLKAFPIPWFVPEHFGGCGLPTAGRFSPRKDVLQVAAKMLRYPELYPLPSIPRNVPWRTWELAKKLSPLPEASTLLVNAHENGASVSYNDYWAKCAVALLFRKGASVQTLMSAPSTPKIERTQIALSIAAHRKLAASWTKARHDASNPFYRFTPLDPNHYPTYHSVHDLPLLISTERPSWIDFVSWMSC
nr:RNA-dependent RNA polymerase [Flumine narna-like virus 48]